MDTHTNETAEGSLQPGPIPDGLLCPACMWLLEFPLACSKCGWIQAVITLNDAGDTDPGQVGYP